MLASRSQVTAGLAALLLLLLTGCGTILRWDVTIRAS